MKSISQKAYLLIILFLFLTLFIYINEGFGDFSNPNNCTLASTQDKDEINSNTCKKKYIKKIDNKFYCCKKYDN